MASGAGPDGSGDKAAGDEEERKELQQALYLSKEKAKAAAELVRLQRQTAGGVCASMFNVDSSQPLSDSDEELEVAIEVSMLPVNDEVRPVAKALRLSRHEKKLRRDAAGASARVSSPVRDDSSRVGKLRARGHSDKRPIELGFSDESDTAAGDAEKLLSRGHSGKRPIQLGFSDDESDTVAGHAGKLRDSGKWLAESDGSSESGTAAGDAGSPGNDGPVRSVVVAAFWAGLKVIQSRCKAQLPVHAYASCQFMTLNKAAGVNKDERWDAERVMQKLHTEGRAGLEDVATARAVYVDEAAQAGCLEIGTLIKAVNMRREELDLGDGLLVLCGDLQTRPIGSGDSHEPTWFFEDPEIDSASAVIVPLTGSYRVRDARAEAAIFDLKIRNDTSRVREFLARAEFVSLAGHEKETLHLFHSNAEADRYSQRDLIKIYGKSNVRMADADPRRELNRDQLAAFQSKFVPQLVIVEGEDYLISLGDEQIEVDGELLRNRDVVRCVRRRDEDGRAWFRVMCREGYVIAKLGLSIFTAEYRGVQMQVQQIPVRSARYGPVFSKQGSSASYVWLHAEKLKGDNIAYVGVTRCEGSPYDQRLKISGMFKACLPPRVKPNGDLDWSGCWVHGDEALRIKWTACPKSVVFQQIVYQNVPPELYQRALQSIPRTAAWAATLEKLQSMRVLYQTDGVGMGGSVGSSGGASSSGGAGSSGGASSSSSMLLDGQQRLAIEAIAGRWAKIIILVGGAGSGKSQVLTHVLSKTGTSPFFGGGESPPRALD